MARTILVLGAGRFQLPLIEKARAMGYRVAATDANPSAVGLCAADYPYSVDLKDVEGCVRIARERRVSGVLSVASEHAVRTGAAVSDALRLPGVPPAVAQAATDKSLMRERFAQHGVPSALSRRCWSLDEAAAHARQIGLPVVVKPADNAGSRGVSLVTRLEELPTAYAEALQHSGQQMVLVEEFMPGVEISVEGFVHGGRLHVLAYSDKVRTAPPHLLDTTVLFPSEQPAAVLERAGEVARMAVEAIGIELAAVHIEQIVTPDGPRMVELAARGAGFHVFTDMLPWVTGVDLVAQLITASVGEGPDFTVTRRRGSVLRFPEAPPGLVREVTGAEDARRIPGIFACEFYVRPGDEIRPLTSGSERVGHIIAMAQTRQQAAEMVRQAERLVRIEVEPSALVKPAAARATWGAERFA